MLLSSTAVKTKLNWKSIVLTMKVMGSVPRKHKSRNKKKVYNPIALDESICQMNEFK